MNDSQQPIRKSLSVLNPNDKVEQLRREFAQDPSPPPAAETTPAIQSKPSPQHAAVHEKVVEALRTVFDPEIPLNVYDLGLIYGIQINPDISVDIKMTLTAPGCPVAGMIVADVERKVENIDEVKSAKVELVWDPPWTKSRMSEAALLELGLL